MSMMSETSNTSNIMLGSGGGLAWSCASMGEVVKAVLVNLSAVPRRHFADASSTAPWLFQASTQVRQGML